MRTRLFAVIASSGLISGLILASASGALAQSDQWCNEYANQAVIATTQNKDFGCGFNGGRWGFDYRVHYNWCMTVPQPIAVQERLARQANIKSSTALRDNISCGTPHWL
jgi:hypothetical protein